MQHLNLHKICGQRVCNRQLLRNPCSGGYRPSSRRLPTQSIPARFLGLFSKHIQFLTGHVQTDVFEGYAAPVFHVNRKHHVPNSLEMSTQISSSQSKSRNSCIAKLKFSENTSQVPKTKGLYCFRSNLRAIVLWLGWTELLIH